MFFVQTFYTTSMHALNTYRTWKVLYAECYYVIAHETHKKPFIPVMLEQKLHHLPVVVSVSL